jgi:hypothetical protein
MTTLTRAELARYPGHNDTDRALSHHLERAEQAPARPRRLSPAPHGALALPRWLDLRPFPGRDRTERVMGWLLAHVPRSQSWSDDSLREIAARIAAQAETRE